MKKQNITRIFTLLLVLCMYFSMMSTTAFAATSEPIEKDYMNYDFPENAEIIYQGEDGVIYSTPSEGISEEQIAPRTLTYNQVWVDAGKTMPINFMWPTLILLILPVLDVYVWNLTHLM